MSLTSFFHLECVLDSVVTMKTKGQTNYQILIPYILSIMRKSLRILCINNMELNLIPSLLIDKYSSHSLSSRTQMGVDFTTDISVLQTPEKKKLCMGQYIKDMGDVA